MNPQHLKNIVEAALLAADQPLTVDQLLALFTEAEPLLGRTPECRERKDAQERATRDEIRQALDVLRQECESRGIELKEVSSGYRFQVRQDLAPWIARLWEERTPRYSRALLETLALIAYRQPITRAEIEDIRGVAVSSNIIKTLQEREWIRVLGHREVPGRPALYGTTRDFLDFFNLKSLGDLPALAEISSLDDLPEAVAGVLPSTALVHPSTSQLHLSQSDLNSSVVALYPVARDAAAESNDASAHG